MCMCHCECSVCVCVCVRARARVRACVACLRVYMCVRAGVGVCLSEEEEGGAWRGYGKPKRFQFSIKPWLRE